MSRPRIHLYMPCWNEETLLPHFFRHYGFVDRFVIFDNGSTDATRALIAAEPRAELRDFDTGGQIDERAYLRIKNEAWKESRGAADFVIVCDADEFLYHPALDRLLDLMRATGATVLTPAGYDMVGPRPPRLDEDLLETVPDGARRYEFDKCVLFDPAAIEEIGYGVGAHICAPRGRVRHFSRPGLALLHYKYLGFDYVRRRFEASAPRVSAYNRAHGYALGYQETAARTARRVRLVAHLATRVVPLPGAMPAPLQEPDDLDAVRMRAIAARAAEDWPAARAGFDQVLAWRPDDLDSLAGLGTVLHGLTLDNDAAWCFRRALALDPERPGIWLDFGNLMLATRSARRAAGCFRSALRRRPDFPEAWLQLGNALAAAGDIAGAEGAWRQAVKRAPGFAPALRRLGAHLAGTGRAREAAPFLRAVADPAS